MRQTCNTTHGVFWPWSSGRVAKKAPKCLPRRHRGSLLGFIFRLLAQQTDDHMVTRQCGPINDNPHNPQTGLFVDGWPAARSGAIRRVGPTRHQRDGDSVNSFSEPTWTSSHTPPSSRRLLAHVRSTFVNRLGPGAYSLWDRIVDFNRDSENSMRSVSSTDNDVVLNRGGNLTRTGVYIPTKARSFIERMYLPAVIMKTRSQAVRDSSHMNHRSTCTKLHFKRTTGSERNICASGCSTKDQMNDQSSLKGLTRI